MQCNHLITDQSTINSNYFLGLPLARKQLNSVSFQSKVGFTHSESVFENFAKAQMDEWMYVRGCSLNGERMPMKFAGKGQYRRTHRLLFFIAHERSRGRQYVFRDNILITCMLQCACRIPAARATTRRRGARAAGAAARTSAARRPAARSPPSGRCRSRPSRPTRDTTSYYRSTIPHVSIEYCLISNYVTL